MGTEHNMAQPNVNQENRTQHGTTKREPWEQNTTWAQPNVKPIKQNTAWHNPNVNQENRIQHGTTKREP